MRNLVTRAGVSERVAMSVTGHKTRSVFDRYHIVSGVDQEEAIRKLAALPEEKVRKVVAIGETRQTASTTPHSGAPEGSKDAQPIVVSDVAWRPQRDSKPPGSSDELGTDGEHESESEHGFDTPDDDSGA